MNFLIINEAPENTINTSATALGLIILAMTPGHEI